MDLLDQYARASAWNLDKVAGAAQHLDADTPCEGWDVRTLLNHMLQTQHYFLGSAQGQQVAPPAGDPPPLLGPDPVVDLGEARNRMLEVFADPDVQQRTGPALGIAFADQLLHGWDLALATGQDPLMPNGLPEAAYELVHGAFTDDQRKGTFGPEIEVDDGASAQDKLLGYTGRQPQPR